MLGVLHGFSRALQEVSKVLESFNERSRCKRRSRRSRGFHGFQGVAGALQEFQDVQGVRKEEVFIRVLTRS